MYHGENAFTLSWRQLWGCNSPSGYKNKFSARVVIISASVSFFLCSERIESLWQGLQISKHRGILSLSPQGLAFMSSHSCRLSPFPLLQNQDPHECPLQWLGVLPSASPGDGRVVRGFLQHLCRAQVALGWVSAMQAGEMCIWLFQGQGNMGFPLHGVRNGEKKGENLFYLKFFWGICLTSNTPSLQGSPAAPEV